MPFDTDTVDPERSDSNPHPHRFRLGQTLHKSTTDTVAAAQDNVAIGTGEPVLAVAIRMTNGRINYFLTLGKPFHRKTLVEIAKWTLQRSGGFPLDGIPDEAEICYSLKDAMDEPFFHEKYAVVLAALACIQNEVEHRKVCEQVQQGEHFYYLGSTRQRSKMREHHWSMK